MNWLDFNYYEMHKIEDEDLKKLYIGKYYLYITKISSPIIEELEKAGLSFYYSRSTRKLTVREMISELLLFCHDNGLEMDDIKKVVGVKR